VDEVNCLHQLIRKEATMRDTQTSRVIVENTFKICIHQFLKSLLSQKNKIFDFFSKVFDKSKRYLFNIDSSRGQLDIKEVDNRLMLKAAEKANFPNK
jgi:hypothetical protein